MRVVDEHDPVAEQRRSRWLGAGGAIALVVLVVVIAVITTRNGDDDPDGAAPPAVTTTVAPTSTTLAPTTTLAVPTVTGTATVGQFPYHVMVADGSVWVLAWYDDAIQRVDPETLAVDTVVVDPTPGKQIGNRMAYADGEVWVAGRTVHAVDSRTLERRAMAVDGGAIAVGAGHGSLWAVQYHGVLVRLDPVTGAVQATIALPSAGAMDIAMTEDAVWVLAQGVVGVAGGRPSWLVRIDPAMNTITHRTDMPDFAVRVVADDRGVVVGTTEKPAGQEYGTLLIVDPATAAIVTTVRTTYRPEGVALAGDHVWAGACSGGFAGGVCAYDRATLAPVASVDAAAFSLAAGEGAIWAVRGVTTGPFQTVGALDRIEPGPHG